jgi:hypothetical protein
VANIRRNCYYALMNCSKMEALREQRDVILSKHKPQMEIELARISAEMKDHQNFWHPYNCEAGIVTRQ